jgi:HK97 family phage major capsid protein
MANIHTIVEMRRDRANLVKQYEEVLNRATEETRELTTDEENQIDRIMKDEDELRKKIEREEWLEERNSQLSGHENRFKAQREDDKTKLEYRDVFKKWAISGVGSLNEEERSVLQGQYQNLGPEERALAVGTGAAGGFTVPQDFFNKMTDAMKSFGCMYECSTILPTDTGASLPMPTSNDTQNKGRIIGENVPANTNVDPAFGQKTLGAYIYTSDIVLVPVGLLQDSAFDLETWLATKLGERIGRIGNEHFTIGDGVNKPRGIITDASVGKVGVTGQTTSVTFEDLLDLEHAVDPAYRAKAKFKFHDTTLKAIKKLKDSQGRPLFLPGVAYKEPDTINGFGYWINQDMPIMAAGAKSIAFGVMESYYIRLVKNPITVRFGEKYMDSFQIGFATFQRQDGLYLNAGTNPIALYQNSES